VPNEKLPLLYQTGQVFCMPSPEELQSIATLEAMASGRPVLAANARALPELVAHGENGYLFEPGQSEAVADGMAYLVDHRDEWPRMGQASREHAVEHSLENTIRRYEEVYQKAIECHNNSTNGKPCGKTPKKGGIFRESKKPMEVLDDKG
jgi:1,2-diacylglycerol 3-alpha-glucosyltransferase